jgi:hypothetical protein
MPRQAKKLSLRFNKRARELNAIRMKMESLFRSGELNAIDVEEVYSGIFLDIFTEFEALLENLFLGLLSRELYTVANPVTRRVIIKPVSMIRDVVFAGKPYLDWLPYTDCTIPRANRFFLDGKPFTIPSNKECTCSQKRQRHKKI